MKYLVSKLIIIAVIFFSGCNKNTEELIIDHRWYTQSQITIGSQLYQINCMVCHGVKGKSVQNWRTPFADGSYPPPPLNGTAHTWHHSLSQLERTIYNGNRMIGGRMPSFKHKLSQSEIKAVIAYIQSLWSEDVYQQWVERGGLNE